MFFFYGVELTVATVAWDNNHFGACRSDLFKFSAPIKDTFFIVPVDQCAATTAAADLVHAIGMQIDPVFHALVENPAWLIKVAVSEPFLRFTPVIAGIMVCDDAFKTGFIQLDPAGFDVIDQQIENRICADVFQNFGVPAFETRPGREIGVASFRP